MVGKIRIGLAGATPGGSSWGANAHIPALKRLPVYQLKAVCTAHEESALAAAKKFGADFAFSDMDAMASFPDVDWIVVCVRVPLHKLLVESGLRADKPVFCEWPLGTNLKEASEMAAMAEERSLPTMVGLQGRSDPAIVFARDLIQQGYVGEVMSANLTVISRAFREVGQDRFYQHDRRNGANTLTITCGHAVDSMCFILGDFVELSARTATRVSEWRNSDTGEKEQVTSPDTISIAGVLIGGTEVGVHVATAFNPTGSRLEIHGHEGTLVLSSMLPHIGPNRLSVGRHGEKVKAMPVPDGYLLPPETRGRGFSANVAQAYGRLASALQAGERIEPDFNAAVNLHRVIDAIERSAMEGRKVFL